MPAENVGRGVEDMASHAEDVSGSGGMVGGPAVVVGGSPALSLQPNSLPLSSSNRHEEHQ